MGIIASINFIENVLKNPSIYIYILFISIQLSCAKKTDCSVYSENQIPKTLDEALLILECSTSDDFKLKFKNQKESEAISMIHFGLGRKIRNDWYLWDAKNELYKSFKLKNITSPDDISSIILTSFHRKLNNVEIKLDEQLQEHYAYFEKVKKIRLERAKKEKEFLNSFKVGDYVKIVMSTGYEGNKAIIGLQSRRYTKDSFNNCFVNGYIIKRDSTEHPHQYKEHFVDIKIDYICEYREVKFRDSTLKKGDILKYSISYNNIEKADPKAKKRVN